MKIVVSGGSRRTGRHIAIDQVKEKRGGED